MSNIFIIWRRELGSYFASPLAYVFIIIFLALSAGTTFYLGAFLERGQADLSVFFSFHPWLYLFLIPSVAMRLWAEERKAGTLEFLMTLPVSTGETVVGKYLAAWAFTGVALALTFPIWITVNYLGDPDNGVIFASYIGSWLMAGGFLASGACMSALTKSQVIAFVLAATACFLFLMMGLDLVLAFFQGWAPEAVVAQIARFSLLTSFQSISQGVIDIRDAIFFLTLIGVCLFINTAIIELKKTST